MHTEKECYHSRPADSERHDYTRKGQLDRVLWAEEPIDATRMVGGWRTVPVTVCGTTHREEEAALGTFSARRVIDRLSRERIVRLLHTRHRHRHHRLAHHTRKSRRPLRAEAHSRTGTHGRHILAQQEL